MCGAPCFFEIFVLYAGVIIVPRVWSHPRYKARVLPPFRHQKPTIPVLCALSTTTHHYFHPSQHTIMPAATVISTGPSLEFKLDPRMDVEEKVVLYSNALYEYTRQCVLLLIHPSVCEVNRSSQSLHRHQVMGRSPPPGRTGSGRKSQGCCPTRQCAPPSREEFPTGLQRNMIS